MFAEGTLIFGVLFCYILYVLIQSYTESRTGSVGGSNKQNNELNNPIVKLNKNKKFGKFTLTDAVHLTENNDLIPTECYKISTVVTEGGKLIDSIIISASAEKLLHLLDRLISELGNGLTVAIWEEQVDSEDVFIHYAYNKDSFFVQSVLLIFDDLLLCHGYVGLRFNTDESAVFLEPNKVIIIETLNADSFLTILNDFEIIVDEKSKMYVEEEILIMGHKKFESEIERLKNELSVEESILISKEE